MKLYNATFSKKLEYILLYEFIYNSNENMNYFSKLSLKKFYFLLKITFFISY